MRKKTVQLDGAEFTIAPLTFKQYRELITERPAETAAPQTADQQWANSWEIICSSINRAGADPAWTAARCNDELDISTVQWLIDEILGFSGLKRIDPQGETQATLTK